MKLLKTDQDVSWAPKPNSVELVAGGAEPPARLCTSAYAFAFDAAGRLLMADLDRGVDIPGGHLDPGESAIDGMRREVKEETGVTLGAAKLFAVQKVTVAGPKPENYPYPYPESYQLFYFSTELTVGRFATDEDSKGPRFVAPEEAGGIPWLQRNRAVYELALALFNAEKLPAARSAPKP
jgi:8-oxo-dGTP diphosphatase